MQGVNLLTCLSLECLDFPMNELIWVDCQTYLFTIKIQIDCLFWKRVLFLSHWVWVISNKCWHLPNNGNMNFTYWSIFCHVPSKLWYSDNDCMINFFYWKKVVTKHLLRKKYVDHSHVRGTPKSFTYFVFLFIINKNIFGKMLEVGTQLASPSNIFWRICIFPE